MRSEALVVAAVLSCAGCARVQRGPQPICYRKLGEVPVRGVTQSESLSVSLVEKHEDKSKPDAVIYRRVPSESEVRQLARKREESASKRAAPAPQAEADQEKVRLRRLLEFIMITTEMGIIIQLTATKQTNAYASARKAKCNVACVAFKIFGCARQ